MHCSTSLRATLRRLPVSDLPVMSLTMRASPITTKTSRSIVPRAHIRRIAGALKVRFLHHWKRCSRKTLTNGPSMETTNGSQQTSSRSILSLTEHLITSKGWDCRIEGGNLYLLVTPRLLDILLSSTERYLLE